MEQTEIRQRIREHLLGNYLAGQPADSLKDDEDLLLVLNSLQILRMVIELESMFGISIDNSDMTPENLGSVQNIASFIAGKQT